MSQDGLFRLLMIAGTAPVMAIALYFRLKSFASHESLDRRQEGVFMLATLRPSGAILWLSVLAYLVHPAWMAWSSMPLPIWLRWAGLAVVVGGAACLYWTLSTLGPNLTDTVATREAHTLVTRGPYQWVRHPFYGSATLLILGVTLLAANWFFLLMGGMVIALLVVRTRKEEDNLVARFGDSYRSYMARTGRFLPRLRARPG